MIKGFNKDEKMALIAILKYIVNADGIITEEELSKFNAIAEQKGFDDFHEIFNEVDREVKSLDDIKELVKRVKADTHKKDIIKYSVEIAIADANINPEEAEILKFMSEEWGIDPESI